MPKLYGELITDSKMRVDIISYSGNCQGGVEVEEILEGEGVHFVNPLTGEQWFENSSKNNKIEELSKQIEEMAKLLKELAGDQGEMEV